jgi:hypothetical protein
MTHNGMGNPKITTQSLSKNMHRERERQTDRKTSLIYIYFNDYTSVISNYELMHRMSVGPYKGQQAVTVFTFV